VKHTKILLVEESAPTRRLLRGMLRDLGYTRVEEAGDVTTADKLLKGHTFDVILLDWRKPRLEGIGLLRRLRGNESPVAAMTPVIVMSSAIDLALLQMAASLGARSVLTKPFSLGVLRSHLEALAGASSVQVQRAPKTRAAPAPTSEPTAAPLVTPPAAPESEPEPEPEAGPEPSPEALQEALPEPVAEPDEADIFYL
jgi:two-component system chemotaxis response regulator CheY